LKRRYVLAFFQKLPPCLIGIEACAPLHYWSREPPGARAYGALDACSLREALRQATEERRH
jgi:transposase